jgi:outer membrane protein assembly factor BamA
VSEGEKPDPPRRSGWLRRLRRLIGALALTIVALVLVLHLPFVQRALITLGITRLSGPLGARITYRDVSFNLLAGRIALDGFTLGADGVPNLVAADHVVVRFPWEALRGRLDDLDVTLDFAKITLIQKGGKWTTIPARWLQPSARPGAPRPVPAFAAIRLHNVTVRYEDTDARFIADTTGLSVELLPDGSGERGSLAGGIAPGAVTRINLEPRGTTLRILGGTARFSPHGAGVDALRIDAPEGRVSTNVRFTFRGTNRFQLKTTGTLRGESLGAWLEPLGALRGTLNAEFAMPAAGGAPAFADVKVTAQDLSWRNLPIREVAAQGALDVRGITLNSTALRIGSGSGEGSGRLAWGTSAESRATVSWRDLDAGGAWSTLLAFSKGASWVAPGSIVSGQFAGRWVGWHAAALNGRLRTTWRPRRAGLARGEHLWLDGTIDATFANGPWNIDVDAKADGALGLHGTIHTRGSTRDFGDWPIEGTLALSGPTAPVLHDAFRLMDLDFDAQLHDATGEVSGEAVLSRTFSTIQAAIALDSTLVWPDQPEVTVHARATVDPDALIVDEWHAVSGPATASATAQLDFNRDTVEAALSGEQVAIEAWTRRFGLGEPVTGLVRVDGHVTGPLTKPVFDASVQGGPVVAAGQTFSAIESRVRFADSVLTIDDGTLVARDGGDLALHGSWAVKSGIVDGAATVHALALSIPTPAARGADSRPGSTLSAVVDGDAQVTGTAASPIVRATLHTPVLKLDDRSLGPLTAVVTTLLGRAQVSLEADDLGAGLEGVVELGGARRFIAELKVQTADSPIVSRVQAIDLDVGAMDLLAHASGALTTPALSSFDVTVSKLDAMVGGLAVAVAPGARAFWQPGRLSAQGLTVSTGGSRLTIDGQIDGTPAHTLTASVDGRLEDFRPLVVQALQDGYDTLVMSGPISAVLRASGALDLPTIAGDVQITDAELGDGVHPSATGVTVSAALDRETLTLQLAEAHWQGAHIAVDGTVPSRFLYVRGATPGGAASLKGHIDNVTIRALAPLVEADELQATDFNLNADYTITAREPTLDALEAELHITRAELKSRELGIAQQTPAHFTLKNRLLTLDPWTIGAPWSTSTRVTLSGAVRLTDAPTVDAKVEGGLDLRALGLVFGTSRPSGTAAIKATIAGPLQSPDIAGTFAVRDGQLIVRNPRLIFDGVQGMIRFTGNQIALENVHGTVNGGTLEAGGSMKRPGQGQPTGALTATIRSALFDVPRGFRSMVDADLRLTGRPQDTRFTLGGTVTIVEAAYRQSLIVTGGLLSLFQSKDTVVPYAPARPRTGPPLVTLDLRVLSDDSISIDTSYGQVAIGTNLRVLGTPENPRLTGQADIAPGGQLFFGGHTYQIESGRLEFRDPTSLIPNVHLVAQTIVSGYVITMRIETAEGRTETMLSSDPPLSDDDIASLIVSGQKNTSLSAGDLVTQQLAGAISGEITTAVGRAIGFDSVRLETGNPGDVAFDPSVISADSNPTQRITFTKRILPTLEVIVSQNLRDSGQITWIVGWEPIPRFELRFVQLDDLDRSYEFRHDVSFGGGTSARTAVHRIPENVRDVYVAIFGDVTEEDVRSRLRITEGRKFDFYKWQQDRDRLQALFIERGHYEAHITARRDPPTPPQKPTSSTPVDLGYTVDAGGRTALEVTGVKIPDSLHEALVQAWADTPIDALLPDEFDALLKPWLAKDGYLQASVSTSISVNSGTKTARVTVTPGPQTTDRVVAFTGNTAISSKKLDEALTSAGLRDRLWSAPGSVQAVVISAYHDLGYLGAKVTVGSPQFTGNRAELPVEIVEGGVYHVGTVKVVDSKPTPAEGVDLTPPVEEGAVLTDAVVAQSARQLQQRYRLAGYRATRVASDSTPRQDPTTVDLVFRVTRGDRLVFGTLAIQGAEGPERELIEKLIPFAPGDPISLQALNRVRDRLYDTDLFRTVSIDGTPRRTAEGQRAEPVVDATVTVELMPKYRLRYGFQLFDPYKPSIAPKWGSVDPGVVADLTRRGLFGRGLTAGVSARINPTDRVVRGYLTSREFLGRPAQTSLYIGDEWQRSVEGPFSLEERTRDVTMEQRLRFRRYGVQVSYGYNFQRLNQDLLVELPGIPVPIPFAIDANISRLIASLFLDRRDNVIDTNRGWFHSTSADFGPEWLGSTAGFRKYLLQQFMFLPVPGSIVLGSAARYELVSGAGQRFITTERLQAGGAYTVRGYDDVTLEILAGQRAPTGQTSLLVLNQEIRFPIFHRFRGAMFWDHANFYGDVDLGQEARLRNSIGGGIRLVLPFLLVRVDYGYPLNKDPVNDKGRWYFAIGQAF